MRPGGMGRRGAGVGGALAVVVGAVLIAVPGTQGIEVVPAGAAVVDETPRFSVRLDQELVARAHRLVPPGGLLEAELGPGVEVEDLGDGLLAVAGDDLTAETLAAVPAVAEVGVDALGTLAVGPDPDTGQQWALRNTGQEVPGLGPGRAGVDVGWDPARQVADGSGVTVAVVDSSVDRTHPDLADVDWWAGPHERCTRGTTCIGWDFVDDDGDPFETGAGAAHATSVIGTIAAGTANEVGGSGAASGVTVMALRVAPEGGTFPSARAAAAVRFAVDHGADVINASFATSPGGGTPTELAAAVAYATERGVLVVAAAGNDGADLDRTPVWPACFPGVLTVGASTNTDGLASFTNRGAGCVDLVAPGQAIHAPTAGGAYAYRSGTSLAAPFVTAGAALVAEHTGAASADDLRAALLDGVVPAPGAAAGRTASGGRLSLAGALGLTTPASELTVDHTGLDDLAPGEVSTGMTVRANAPLANLQLTFGAVVDGLAYAIVGHPVRVGSPAGSVTASTDPVGDVTLALQPGEREQVVDGLELAITTQLPTGRYLWMVTATDTTGRQLPPVVVHVLVGDVEGSDGGVDGGADGDGGSDGGDGGTDDGTGDSPGGDVPGDGDGGADGPPGGGGTDDGDDAPGPGDGAPGGGSDDGTGPGPEAPGTDDGGEDPPGGGGSDGPPARDDSDGADDGADDDPGDGGDDDGTGGGPTDGGDGGGGSDDGDGGVRPAPGDVSPATGTELGGETVHVRTPEPSVVRSVYFGTNRAEVVHTTSDTVVVLAPPGRPGIVDVSLSNGARQLVRYLAAYTYLPAPGTPGDDPDDSDDDGGDDDGDEEPDDGGGGGDPDGGTAPPTVGAARTLSNGLTVVRYSSHHPLGRLTPRQVAQATCRTDPCRATTV